MGVLAARVVVLLLLLHHLSPCGCIRGGSNGGRAAQQLTCHAAVRVHLQTILWTILQTTRLALEVCAATDALGRWWRALLPLHHF
eukprot:scaffold6823_cov34-Phaeocystis_antarctica.AAC.2